MGTLNAHLLNSSILFGNFNPTSQGWYCPHCCRLPQFRRSRKVKENSSEIIGRALSLDSACICQAVPQQSDKLLECHSEDCQSGKFYHLTCLGYNSKTAWKCSNCKKNNAKPFHESTAVPASKCQENSVSITTCSAQSHDSEPEFIELDNAQDSDSEG